MRPAHLLVPAAFTALVAAYLVVRGADATMLAYDIPIAWPFAAYPRKSACPRSWS